MENMSVFGLKMKMTLQTLFKTIATDSHMKISEILEGLFVKVLCKESVS